MACSESRVPSQAVPPGVKSPCLQERAGSRETSFTCGMDRWPAVGGISLRPRQAALACIHAPTSLLFIRALPHATVRILFPYFLNLGVIM